jgi:glucose-6-phosphate 1-dehydrogenase
VLRIGPDEGISLQFEVKRRGPLVDLAAVKMDFHYDDWFPKEPSVGYETLLYDVMTGDQTRFTRADMVEHAWRIVQPVLDAWAAEKAAFPNYESGSDGPQAADELLTADCGGAWRPLVAPAQKKEMNVGAQANTGRAATRGRGGVRDTGEPHQSDDRRRT